jgi:hypothetical protein
MQPSLLSALFRQKEVSMVDVTHRTRRIPIAEAVCFERIERRDDAWMIQPGGAQRAGFFSCVALPGGSGFEVSR